MIQRSEYFSVANDTKWRELRAAMLGLDGADQPDFRCKDLESGVLGRWDGEWYYHWQDGGWESMEWAELSVKTARRRDLVRAVLKRIRFAGEETAEGFRIFGYVRNGQPANHIK
jgi:hypothetical protein